MQQDPPVAECLDSTTRTLEVLGSTRQVLVLALCVGKRCAEAKGHRTLDPDANTHRVRGVMAMVYYGEARGGLWGTLYKWCPHRPVPQERQTTESLTWCKMDKHDGSRSSGRTGARR